MNQFVAAARPHLLSVLRIVTGFLFMQHGGQKLLGFPAPQREGFELFSLVGLAGVLELFGGLLIVLGVSWPCSTALCFCTCRQRVAGNGVSIICGGAGKRPGRPGNVGQVRQARRSFPLVPVLYISCPTLRGIWDKR